MDDDFVSKIPDFLIFVIGLLLWAFWNFYAKDLHLTSRKSDEEKEPEYDRTDVEIRKMKVVVPSAPLKQAKKQSHVPRTVRDTFNYKTPLTDFSRESAIDERSYQSTVEKRNMGPRIEADVISYDLITEDYAKAYDIVEKVPESRAAKLLASMPNRKRMIVIHEIFSKPKGLGNPYR
jgi:hypothetical protein